MSGLKLMLVGLLWAVYVLMLTRAVLRRHGLLAFRYAVWGMYFGACVAFTFTGRETELAADALLGGLPVSIYIKYFAMTQLAYLYWRLLDVYRPVRSATRQTLHAVNGVALAAGVVSFGLLASNGSPAHPDVRYYVNAGRDTVVGVFMLLAILPRHVEMIRLESVQTMRIKHVVYALLCITYLLVVATSLLSVGVVVLDLAEMDDLLPVFLPLTYIAYGFFLLALIPHRWTAVLLFPARLFAYWRLRRLQRAVTTLAHERVPYSSPAARPFSLGGLEFAIYQTVIGILDHAAHLPATAPTAPLTQQLTTVLATQHDYPLLVNALVRLRYD